MDKEYNDTDINKNICQAVGCFAKATDKIALKGGTFGIISVLVCRNCIENSKTMVFKKLSLRVYAEKEVR
jgi:hypothetical protein